MKPVLFLRLDLGGNLQGANWAAGKHCGEANTLQLASICGKTLLASAVRKQKHHEWASMSAITARDWDDPTAWHVLDFQTFLQV